MALFVDTSGLYAVLDRDDACHPRARTLWETVLSSDEVLWTTDYVVVELLALAQHRIGMLAVRAVADDVLPVLEIEWVTPEDHRTALEALLAANRRHLSFVDCASFVIMRRIGLESVFAFDEHFREQGFQLLPS